MKRRGFLGRVGIGVGTVLGGALGVGYLGGSSEAESLELERVKAPVRGLSSALEGFRIVALSDFHLHPFTKLSFLERAFELARAQRPDLVVLLGDFVDQSLDAIEELCPALSMLDARFGLCAVLGNHDFRKGASVVADCLERVGVEVLRNRGMGLAVGGGEQLWVAGLDSWAGEQRLGDALGGRRDGVTTVVLAHEPDVALGVAQVPGVHVQLSGHSHGGQVNVPGLVDAMLPRMGRRFAFGSYRVGELFLHTSRGLGTTQVPLRFRSVPEVSVVTLEREA